MMPSPPIHHRTDTGHFARLFSGSAPACAGSRVWPVGGPQIPRSNPPSARSRQDKRRTRPDRRSPLNASNALAEVKSP